jgi:hypothetical protein
MYFTKTDVRALAGSTRRSYSGDLVQIFARKPGRTSSRHDRFPRFAIHYLLIPPTIRR